MTRRKNVLPSRNLRRGEGAPHALSTTTRIAATDAVAPFEGHVRLCAQSEPDVARFHAGGECFGGGTTSDRCKDEVGHQGATARTELVGDGAVEFATTHAVG
jgi:hypothetical protein